MIDKATGQVAYAILGFGGFFGIGTNLLPLPWACTVITEYRHTGADTDLQRTRMNRG